MLPWRYLTEQTRVSFPDLPIDQFRIVPWSFGVEADLVFDILISGRGCFQMELESIAVSDILELKAVLDSSAYNSLLTVSVQSRRKNNRSVFVFQCHDVRVRAHSNYQHCRAQTHPIWG